ncbi:hypothetical protein BJY52DRAFT_1228436 [Lactarius psammicola]|nr:hypothetical protein BJY52DRAFT_1228436 [Lactarius psammicola]
MSRTPTTAAASSRFQAIFNAALRSYEMRTKKDLIAHPLASQLQTCNSTSAILAVLQDQVWEFDKACSGDERLTKWLNPTVNVLYAFSAILGEGVSLVFSPAKVIFAGIGVFLLASILSISLGVIATRPVGGQGCCGKQRCSRRPLRTHGILFSTARSLYSGHTDSGDDKHNHEDNGGSAYNLWDRNERAEAETSK